jgi:hypothetical protein
MAEQPQRIRPKSQRPSTDDTAERSLSKVERRRLGMDSWEPSLLRKLLAAQNRLRKQQKP